MPSQSNFYQLKGLMISNHDVRWVGCNDVDNSCLAPVEGDKENAKVNSQKRNSQKKKKVTKKIFKKYSHLNPYRYANNFFSVKVFLFIIMLILIKQT